MSNNKIVFTGKSSALTFTNKLKEGIKSLKEEKQIMKQLEGIVLLLDTSGSMDDIIEGKRKIDHLREVVSEYPNIKKVSFSNRVIEDYMPEASGSTNMPLAFEYLKNMNMKINKVILISDGLPQDMELSIIKAKELGVPVNIIYIGPGGDIGEEFMQRLAKETGGKEVTIDTNLINIDLKNQLTKKLKLMLPKGGE